MSSFTLDRNNNRRKLITLVKQSPILWNKKEANYNRNRAKKYVAWQQISKHMHIPVEKLRRTWENLRDQYRRDLKREVRFGFKSKWRFFADMNFIRDMVSCKQNELKETEFTDSDSEVDVTDNHQAKTPQNGASVIPTPNQTVTTPCTSTMPSSDSHCDTDMVPFQPIVLTKLWEPPAQSTSQACSNPEENFPSTIHELDFPPNCDSSKDCGVPNNLTPTHEENLVKQEPHLDLELYYDASTAIQQEFTSSAEQQNASNFEEARVSTSSYKRCHASIEESSDIPTPTVSRSHMKTDTDLSVKDDDYYFVMSLLPSLRQIPRNRKFPLRIGIMNLIAKDLEEVCKE